MTFVQNWKAKDNAGGCPAGGEIWDIQLLNITMFANNSKRFGSNVINSPIFSASPFSLQSRIQERKQEIVLRMFMMDCGSPLSSKTLWEGKE